MTDADLKEIQGYVKQSFLLKSQVKQSDASSADIKEAEWFSPVACSAVPDPDESENEKLEKEPVDIRTLDVIRAFSDPRVIKVVADILEENV